MLTSILRAFSIGNHKSAPRVRAPSPELRSLEDSVRAALDQLTVEQKAWPLSEASLPDSILQVLQTAEIDSIQQLSDHQNSLADIPGLGKRRLKELAERISVYASAPGH